MARLASPIVTRAIVFIRQRIADGAAGTMDTIGTAAFKYYREGYDIVTLNWGDGTPIQSYASPHGGEPLSYGDPNGGTNANNHGTAGGERLEIYDEVKIFDSPPFPKTRIGYSQISGSYS